jgi:PAS domain S-box-containing protein
VEKTQEQQSAEADVDRFRQELGPFVVAAESTRMAMVFTDAKSGEHAIIFANDSFLALTGYARDEVLGRRFTSFIEHGTDSLAAKRTAAEFSANASAASEICCTRKNVEPFWAAVFVTPVVDEAGDVVQHFASLIDLSEHKEEEAASRRLIDELNHRVKNTLATVRAIVSQGLRSSDDLNTVRDSIDARLFALSRSHDLLTRENWNGAVLHDVVNEALTPFGLNGSEGARFRITGGDVRLKPNQALTLGIALHELATNAGKYGALSGETGSVQISWEITTSPNGERLHLTWRETGGPLVVPPTRKGFGTRVIERGLPHELHAEARLEYKSDGLVCTIDMPAPRSEG